MNQINPAHIVHEANVEAADGTNIHLAVVCPPPLTARADKPGAIFAGYTRTELEAAFDRVKPADHWKNPIRATFDSLSADERVAIHAAVAFYTGSNADFLTEDDGKVTVVAAGYFQTIGA